MTREQCSLIVDNIEIVKWFANGGQIEHHNRTWNGSDLGWNLVTKDLHVNCLPNLRIKQDSKMCEKKCPLAKTADGTCEKWNTTRKTFILDFCSAGRLPLEVNSSHEICPYPSKQKPVKSEWDMKVEKAFGLYYGDLVPIDKASHFKKSIREAGLK